MTRRFPPYDVPEGSIGWNTRHVRRNCAVRAVQQQRRPQEVARWITHALPWLRLPPIPSHPQPRFPLTDPGHRSSLTPSVGWPSPTRSLPS